MNDIPQSILARIQELKASGILDDPGFRDAVLNAARAATARENPLPTAMCPLSQEPTKPTELIQGAVPTQSPVQNAPVNLSGTNRPGEQSPQGTLAQHGLPGRWTGAVLEGKARYKPENRNPQPFWMENFQSQPGGESRTGVLPAEAKKAALPPRKAQEIASRMTDRNIPMDRNVPSTRNIPPERANYREGRAYKAAPRRSVYLTTPK